MHLQQSDHVKQNSMSNTDPRHSSDHKTRKEKEALKEDLKHFGYLLPTNDEELEEFGTYSWMQFKILTGRTHQIRVHLNSIGQPLA